MTATSARRIARVRPLSRAAEDEHFFVANDAPDFGSDGRQGVDGGHLAVPWFPGQCRQPVPQRLGNRRDGG